MKVAITGRHMDVGASITTHINEMIENFSDKYALTLMDAQVVMSKDIHHQHNRFKADIVLHLARGIEVRASDEADTAQGAVDESFRVIEKRLRRYKKKIHDHQRHRASHEDKATALQYVLSGEGRHDAEEVADNALVIAESTTEIPSISISEAVMHMDLSDQSAVVFRNAVHGGLNVIYRRADGHIGWVDPRD